MVIEARGGGGAPETVLTGATRPARPKDLNLTKPDIVNSSELVRDALRESMASFQVIFFCLVLEYLVGIFPKMHDNFFIYKKNTKFAKNFRIGNGPLFPFRLEIH